MFFDQYKLASSEGAVLELKLRLLADKIPQLQEFAHAQKLEDIESEISRHFGEALSHHEKSTLGLCRQLRNKILHCNFSVARETLALLGIEPQPGGVRKVDLSLLTATQMAAKTQRAIAGQQGALEYVSMSQTINPGSVFGWLLEMGSAGDFSKAAQAFQEAAAIVDRLANVGAEGAQPGSQPDAAQ